MGNMHGSPIVNKAMLELNGNFELELDVSQIATGLHDTYIRKLGLTDFQLNAGTGTALYPQRFNDGELGQNGALQNEGDYVEIDWGFLAVISKLQYYGSAAENELDLAKLQHWDGTDWVDNTLDLGARDATWTGWKYLTTLVITSKVRLVAYDLAAAPNIWYCQELQLVG